MNIQTKKLSDLRPADYNPRTITARAMKGLSASLERFGNVQPIVWNKRTGNIVGGHQKLKILQAKGAEECDVVVVDLDEADEKALNVSLNSSGITGDFTGELDDIISSLHDDLPDGVFDDLNLDDFSTEQHGGEIKEMKISPPPEMTWVLIGIPTVRYIEISDAILAISEVKDIITETTISGNQDR